MTALPWTAAALAWSSGTRAPARAGAGRTGTATADTDVAAGQPTRARLDLADTRDVDVVGRHGSGRSNEVLGSVAKQVAAESVRPVLLTSPPRVDR